MYVRLDITQISRNSFFFLFLVFCFIAFFVERNVSETLTPRLCSDGNFFFIAFIFIFSSFSFAAVAAALLRFVAVDSAADSVLPLFRLFAVQRDIYFRRFSYEMNILI